MCLSGVNRRKDIYSNSSSFFNGTGICKFTDALSEGGGSQLCECDQGEHHRDRNVVEGWLSQLNSQWTILTREGSSRYGRCYTGPA
uniref:Uncharacterized protein n=1 Tax=Timema tahoe TaxID=61484 RepID=A0A7R9FEM4_9NEOP|nr:unnamed protein product [Timema tahoe]